MVAERSPAMYGSETLTTVESSTTMNVLAMTAHATIHGLTRGASATASEAPLRAAGAASACGSGSASLGQYRFAPLRPFDWAQGVPSIVEGRGARGLLCPRE